MTVPVVGEFWARTSVYGRLAPWPPVAVAAKAGVAASTATPARPAVASVMEVAPARSRRLRPRSFGGLDGGPGWNTVDPLDTWGVARVGDRERSVADCDAKLLDISLQDVDFSQQEIY